ncbi:hypothetical protein KCU98_g2374, partial [Aureobasidium melanogenum]
MISQPPTGTQVPGPHSHPHPRPSDHPALPSKLSIVNLSRQNDTADVDDANRSAYTANGMLQYAAQSVSTPEDNTQHIPPRLLSQRTTQLPLPRRPQSLTPHGQSRPPVPKPTPTPVLDSSTRANGLQPPAVATALPRDKAADFFPWTNTFRAPTPLSLIECVGYNSQWEYDPNQSERDVPSTPTAINDQKLIDRLPFAEQAPFDSHTKQDHPLYLEDTRTEVLKEMRAWTYAADESCISWLDGAAGTGKSTIARTVARDFHERKELGASFFFFFRGGGGAAHAGKFLASIVRQLTIHWPALKRHVSEALREQPDIASKTREDQWTLLVAQALQKMAAQHNPQAMIVIVVDALDECDNDQDMIGLIKELSKAKHIANVRLRIIITSRLETSIRLGFRKIPSIVHKDLLLHNVSRDIVDGDICLFFYSQSENIKLAQD